MANVFMLNKDNRRVGGYSNNDGWNWFNLRHRFQNFIDSMLENTARRIIASVSRKVSGVDISLESQRRDRSVRTYSGFVGHYFIGSKQHYELLRTALRAAGLDDNWPYFETTPTRSERTAVFKGSYDGILN